MSKEGGPPANDPVPTPRGVEHRGQLKALYLFAGTRRKSGLGPSLRRHCIKKGLKVKLVEVDVLRGGRRHDMLAFGRQQRLLSRVKRREYDLVAASPPCSTFSRVRWANRRGPPPLRTKAYPRGFPWLARRWMQSATDANRLVDFTAKVLHEQLSSDNRAMAILEHPEDLGAVRDGHSPGGQVPGPMPTFLLIQPDVISFSATASACEKGAQWQVALGLLSEMGEREGQPDTILFNAAVSA